jgi:hypothetical protein
MDTGQKSGSSLLLLKVLLDEFPAGQGDIMNGIRGDLG